MIGHGCMIGPPTAAGKGIQLIGRMPIIGERRGDVTDGLIHRWRLTENANDAVGTLNLKNNNSVAFSSDGALITNSPNIKYLSNGTSNASYAPPTGAFTFSFWLKPTAWECSGVIATDSGWYVGHDATGCGFEVYNNQMCYLYDGCGGYCQSFSESNFPSTKHTLLTMRFTGSSVIFTHGATQIYSASSTYQVTRTQFQIGDGSHLTIPMYFKDVRVYDRALTNEEVSVLAANGPNP